MFKSNVGHNSMDTSLQLIIEIDWQRLPADFVPSCFNAATVSKISTSPVVDHLNENSADYFAPYFPGKPWRCSRSSSSKSPGCLLPSYNGTRSANNTAYRGR